MGVSIETTPELLVFGLLGLGLLPFTRPLKNPRARAEKHRR